MTKTNAEKDLEIRIGSDISQYDNFSLPDRDYANNLTELIDWCSPHDWSKILYNGPETSIGDFRMIFYNSDDGDRDINAFIVLDTKGDVFSYGYTGD